MPLYTHADCIERALAAKGTRPGDPLSPEQLFGLDQWHYHGIDAIGAAGRALSPSAASRVVDVGLPAPRRASQSIICVEGSGPPHCRPREWLR